VDNSLISESTFRGQDQTSQEKTILLFTFLMTALLQWFGWFGSHCKFFSLTPPYQTISTSYLEITLSGVTIGISRSLA
jgi:hypothetical protein